MYRPKSEKELNKVMDFIHRFNEFVDKYGEWLRDYPPFANGSNRGLLDSSSELLEKNLWYLEQVRDHHWHCNSCGKTYKFINTSKIILKCRCGADMWVCDYQPPSDRRDKCLGRFKCLTENKWDDKMKRLTKVNPDRDDIDDMDDFIKIAEY